MRGEGRGEWEKREKKVSVSLRIGKLVLTCGCMANGPQKRGES